jgi:hypothetical protein
MSATASLTRRQQAAIIATILVVNLVIACVLYETAGWHYIRGYREVTTFLIYPVIFAQAAVNLMLCALLALINLWPRSQALYTASLAYLGAVLMVATSLPIAPLIGSILKYNLVLHTPIVEAAVYRDGELVIKLLESGVDPNAPGRPGLDDTALHWMAIHGNTPVVELLLQKGANPNARADLVYEVPLHAAISNRAPLSTIDVLLEYGADPKLRDRDGRTAFDYAEHWPDPQGSLLRQALSRQLNDPPSGATSESDAQPIR